MLALLVALDPMELGTAWNLSQKAVRSRLNGERDLTLSEVCAVADIIGIQALLDALGSPLE